MPTAGGATERLRGRRRASILVGVAVLGLAAAAAPACSSDDEASVGTAAAPPSAAAAASSVSPTDASVALDPAGRALRDVVTWLEDPALLDPGRFSEVFLRAVPPEQLRSVLASVGPGPWRVVGAESPSPDAVAARLEGAAPAVLVQLAVDADGRIESLLFQPAELADPPADLTSLVERLRTTAPIAGFVRADVSEDGACVPVAELGSDVPLPIGSAFKLYVLGAVATSVAAGEVTWDQPVELRDELDSLPSGTTQDEPDGSSLSVAELAERMISISDNTATDHLIDLVGRDRVEQALTDLGHRDPESTLPLLTTREMFTIKSDPDLLARYGAAAIEERRALLDDEVAAAPLPSIQDFPAGPTAVTTVEWFASPADVCRALVELDDLGAQPDLTPVRDVLAAPDGAPDGADLERVLFKGGSEPGVLFGAWLAGRPDGSRIVVTGGVADEAAPVDPTALQLLALGLTLT